MAFDMSLKNVFSGAGEMAQQLKALAVLAEDPDSVLSTCTGESQPCVTAVLGNLALSSDLAGTQALTVHT